MAEPLLPWLLALAGHGCRIDVHMHGEWDEPAIARLRAAGVCVWTRDWLSGARWHWWRTAGGMLLDDGSAEGRAWAHRLAREAAPDARCSLLPDLRLRRMDGATTSPALKGGAASAVAAMLRALDADAGRAQASSAIT
jgi:hypothetical protein